MSSDKPAQPAAQRFWLAALFAQRSIQLALGAWVLAIILILVLSQGALPFDRPVLAGLPLVAQIIAQQTQLVFALVVVGVVYLITRKRALPDMASRAPAHALARTETVAVLVYGAAVIGIGQLVGRTFGSQGIGLHLHGTIYGATQPITPGEALGWAAYNFVFLAALPYAIFRARGYSHQELNLTSSNVRGDVILILIVLVLESLFEFSISSIFGLTYSQLLLGSLLSFLLHLFGTGLPIMILIYCILLPRYLKLSESLTTTTLLGGLTYAFVHLFEYWAVYDTVPHSLLSIIFVVLQFIGPGMVKSFLTLRTGNAWVHLWAYHAIAPHVIIDTPNIVKIFSIR